MSLYGLFQQTLHPVEHKDGAATAAAVGHGSRAVRMVCEITEFFFKRHAAAVVRNDLLRSFFDHRSAVTKNDMPVIQTDLFI